MMAKVHDSIKLSYFCSCFIGDDQLELGLHSIKMRVGLLHYDSSTKRKTRFFQACIATHYQRNNVPFLSNEELITFIQICLFFICE